MEKSREKLDDAHANICHSLLQVRDLVSSGQRELETQQLFAEKLIQKLSVSDVETLTRVRQLSETELKHLVFDYVDGPIKNKKNISETLKKHKFIYFEDGLCNLGKDEESHEWFGQVVEIPNANLCATDESDMQNVAVRGASSDAADE